MDSDLAEQLRQTAASGEFPKAQALWEEFARRLLGEIERGEIREEDMNAAGELVRSVIQVAQAARAQAAAQLASSCATAQATQAYTPHEKRRPLVVRKNL